MADKTPVPRKGFSADWLMRGALTKIGDTVDRLTGRRWVPSSSIAASELIERIKKLLDAEAKEVPGKGTVVPHNIKLKMQWDKFSADAEDALGRLEQELLTAAADHINDSLYYTYAPLQLKVAPDYFTEGVKLYVSFDKFADKEPDVELNVTIPAINVAGLVPEIATRAVAAGDIYLARFESRGAAKEKRLEFPVGQSLSVGRTGTNALTIDDPSVSKMHASLVTDSEGRLSVADTGSTNGTFLNGQRIAYGKAMHLVEGDKVKFGTVDVVFEHVPRPVVVEPDDETNESEREETVAIDGFEFKRKVSPETPPDSSPAITMPTDELEETQRIDPPADEQNEKTGLETTVDDKDGEPITTE